MRNYINAAEAARQLGLASCTVYLTATRYPNVTRRKDGRTYLKKEFVDLWANGVKPVIAADRCNR